MGFSDKLTMLLSNEPVSCEGIPIYPLTMRNYHDWNACKGVWLIRQATLPAPYIAMPFLSALYAMDYETGFQLGIVERLIHLLSLSTHLPKECIVPLVKTDNPSELVAIASKSNELSFRITPISFTQIRRVVAEINGDKLPDESENPELVEAEQDIAMLNSLNLEYDETVLVASVAYQYRRRINEIADWTIAEFEMARKAIDRDKNHTLCYQAEAQGATFKHGNPCPSWCFDKRKEGTVALESMDSLMSRAGMGTSLPNIEPQ